MGVLLIFGGANVKMFIAGTLFGGLVASAIWWGARRGQDKAVNDVKQFVEGAIDEVKKEVGKITGKL
jgi:hypothetical protein